jgi:hypothetical protein
MRISGRPRHHDSKKQVPIASSEKLDGAMQTGSTTVPQSGLVQPELRAKISHNKYPQKAGLGGFRVKSYASGPIFEGPYHVFSRAAAVTP